MTLGSRLLGFVRDMLMAHVLGASAATDAFFVALRLPNLLRQIFAEGAFNVAFVPMLSRQLEQEGPAATAAFANAVFAALMWLVTGLTAVFMLAMPAVVLLIAPGFHAHPETFALTVNLARITFPYFVFIVFVSFMGGVLNTQHRFAAAAAAPMLLNVSFIACLLLLPKWVPAPAYAAAIAVPVGGVLQMLLVYVAMRRAGVRVRFSLPHKHPLLGTLLGRMLPTMVGVGAQQINTLVSTLLASLLAPASISYLFYADRLNQLPLALIGIAISTALLPTLSRAIKAAPDSGRAAHVFENSLMVAAALGFAAACGLFLLADQVMTILFQRGAFSAVDAHRSALALMAFSTGLPAYILVKLTATAFYAHEDTRTPVRTALVSIGLNLALNLALMPLLAHVGLALATAIAAWCNFIMQFALILRRGLFPQLGVRHVFWQLLKAALLALLLGVWLVFYRSYWVLPSALTGQLLWLLGVVTSALVIWGAGAVLVGLPQALRRPAQG